MPNFITTLLATLVAARSAALPEEALPEEFCSASDGHQDCSMDLRQLRAGRTSQSLAAEEVVASESAAVADKATTCTSLENHGTFSSALVEVGSPPQKFSLVADTGSDNVIVQSCVCKEKKYCPEDFGKCFKGNGKSSTFALQMGEDGPMSRVMSFGSGDILVIQASDKVAVGTESTYMNNSLLLMVKQKLKIRGEFEGILGLGRPHRDLNSSLSRHLVDGFFKSAGVDSFSMCFNNKGPGVLGLNVPTNIWPLQSVGTMHWGVDFQGISIGGKEQPVAFCSPESKEPGMESACGLIPDSGTTLIMGDESQVLTLYTDLCERWDRCKQMHKALNEEYKKMNARAVAQAVLAETGSAEQEQEPNDVYAGLRALLEAGEVSEETSGLLSPPADEQAGVSATEQISRPATLLLLMKNCNTWLKNETLLNQEMPSLFFHIAGKDGRKDVLEITPFQYVISMKAKVSHKQFKKVLGYLPVEITSVTTENVCLPAFDTMAFRTKLNGPTWIMGTPLFYEYQVHYNRARDPPTMNFVRESCGSCVDGKYTKTPASLLEAVAEGARRMRMIDFEPVVSEVDTTLPL